MPIPSFLRAMLGLSIAACANPLGSQVAAPPPSAGHALIYHDSLRAVLLVNAGLGGVDSPAASTRTTIWRWDGASWLSVSDNGPPIRNLGGVAYDAHRDRLVLFGGSYSADIIYDDTWEWSPASGWVRREVAGPGRRDHTDMVYDRHLRRVVLHGGQVGSGFPADTWSWDGTTWTMVPSPDVGSRIHHTMAFDFVRGRTVLFGGLDPTQRRVHGDAWTWTGREWSPLATTAPRSHARMAGGPGGPLLFGGFQSHSATAERLDDAGWTALSGETPGARYLTAMAYDPIRQVTVLFGGGRSGHGELLNDTWEYSASGGWRRIR